MRRLKGCSIVSFFFFFCVGISISYAANDTLRVGDRMMDDDLLESSNKLFQLLFFWSDTQNLRYLGVQRMGLDHFSNNTELKMVWVANRNNPLNDTYGNLLQITQDGNLVISYIDDERKSIILYSGHPATSANTSLTLLDSGNLVLRAEGERIVWQSFDYPSHIWLPGMKLGLFDLNTVKPRRQFLTSWVSTQVPTSGAFTLGIDPNNTKQLVIWRRGVPYWSSGTWNEHNFSYFPSRRYWDANPKFRFSYFSNERESYFTYSTIGSFWVGMNSYGGIDVFTSIQNDIVTYSSLPCDADLVVEQIRGCIKAEPSKCKGGDVFYETSGFISQEDYHLFNFSMGLSDCEEICRTNCSCNAYASVKTSDSSGCIFSSGNVEYLQGAASLFQRYSATAEEGAINDLSDAQKRGLIGKDHELPLFSFSSIQFATDQFSDANKIGQGGFGPVYKGKLVGGLEVAVKRLSRSSGQGLEEFKNEVVLISKLQHRNLVRLLGCCTHGDERILVYEYLQNKSLDSFIFDATKRALLEWKLRICIIEGIAQGLLYLHKYSRLRIIHRDLKTSNVLLDKNMNPKISDFGTARIFGENESRANTSRIVGTYGYMSPEYAMDGLFSEKSDVFSFGVMMLEIISGKKNTGFYQPDRWLNLLGHAWDLWKEGRGVELMDQKLAKTGRPTNKDFLRYVQVGLLCVQEIATDRPIMSNVVSMLSNEMMVLPAPKKPAFSATVCTVNYSVSLQPPEPCSKNEVTISEVHAR